MAAAVLVTDRPPYLPRDPSCTPAVRGAKCGANSRRQRAMPGAPSRYRRRSTPYRATPATSGDPNVLLCKQLTSVSPKVSPAVSAPNQQRRMQAETAAMARASSWSHGAAQRPRRGELTQDRHLLQSPSSLANRRQEVLSRLVGLGGCHGLVGLGGCHGLVGLGGCHGLVGLGRCHGLVSLGRSLRLVSLGGSVGPAGLGRCVAQIVDINGRSALNRCLRKRPTFIGYLAVVASVQACYQAGDAYRALGCYARQMGCPFDQAVFNSVTYYKLSDSAMLSSSATLVIRRVVLVLTGPA
jgi:hypothetical protein